MPRISDAVKVVKRLDARPPKRARPGMEIAQALLVLGLWLVAVFFQTTGQQIKTNEIDPWNVGDCYFAGFAGICSACKMSLLINVLGPDGLPLPTPIVAEWEPPFVYSYFEDRHGFPVGEQWTMFKCCDTRTLSCCDFQVAAAKDAFCDRLGPEFRDPEGQACPSLPWPCMFILDEQGVVTSVKPGLDTRDQSYRSMAMGCAAAAAILSCTHPFTRRKAKNTILETLTFFINCLKSILGKNDGAVEEIVEEIQKEEEEVVEYSDEDAALDRSIVNKLSPGAPARRFVMQDHLGASPHALFEYSPDERLHTIPGLLQPLEWSPLDTTRELAELSRLSRSVEVADKLRRAKPGSLRDRDFRDCSQMSRSLEAVDWRALREQHSPQVDMTQTFSSFGTPKRSPLPIRTDMSMSSVLSPQHARHRSRSVESPPRRSPQSTAWQTPDRARSARARDPVIKLSPLAHEVRWKSLPSGQEISKGEARLKRPKVFENLDGYALFVRPEGSPPSGSPPPPKTLPP